MKRISEIPQETPKRNCPESNAYAEPVTTQNREASCENIENAANNPDETEFATPKHLRDQVFTISLDEKNSKFATCNLCTGKTKTIKMANANTTGLKRHLEREHPKAYIDIYGTVPATLKKNNPFRESILRVFSSKGDGCISFEDTLDLCSALSDNCPVNVRAAWAFQIFDFDGDNQVSLDDLIEAVERVTGRDENGRIRIDRQSAEHVAQMVLQEMDLDHTGSIGAQEFVHTVVRMQEFAQTFRLTP